ncbi:unnamed protein product [Hymenolepis diminuta]|uniref:Uncharacterized protein n=1 Tax=Hymenolepis diminuta TaxID=6216 RepID=A0A0R3SQZ4_HYMDI|nr:unnamed protein product [Hymenolepis diminuta]
MNFLTSTKDPKDYVKDVGIFHCNPLIGETFAIWYAQYRDTYKNSMTDLPHATRITLLLCSGVGDNSFLLNLIISEDENVHHYAGIVHPLCTSFQFGSFEANQYRCLIFILGLRSPCCAEIRLRLLSPLDKKRDVKKSRRRPKSTGGQSTANVQLERT